MSKKMLKRSLALGALMAFVITGSAMAAEEITEKDVDANGIKVIGGIHNEPGNGYSCEEREWKLNSYTLLVSEKTDCDHGGAKDYAVWATDYKFEGGEGSTLQISNADGTALDGRGLATYGNINVDKLVIKTTGISVGVFGVTSITAKDITIESVNGEATTVQSGNLNINTDGGCLTINSYKHGLNTGNNSTINVNTGVLNITATNGNAIVSEYNNSKITVTATDKAIITGNIVSNVSNEVSLEMNTFDSVVTGAITGNGTKNLTLNSGATWKVTDKSDVTTLEGNNANIVVTSLEEEFVTVQDDETEQLTVAAAADADGITGVAEKDLEAVSKTVVTGAGENKKAAADTAQIIGGSVYDIISADIKEDGSLGEINKEVASANISVNDMVAIGMMSWRAEMNDMNKRLGELRNANGEHGVWVRMVRGESEYNSVKNQYNQYQLGYDEKLSTDPSWTVGVALSYTDAENNFKEGNGESTNKALSIYGSKLNEDGTFVDLIAKYARLENDFKTYSGMGDADYDTNAYSFSAEVGKRIQQGKGLWIEPQVELTYGKVSAVDYVTKNKVAVAQDGMESLIGRVGFSLGKDIEKGNVYARASYLYDFDGETKAVLDGDAVLKNDLGGGWWEVGVGANINLSKATYIYADVEKTFGGEVDTNWQWNLGVRYSF